MGRALVLLACEFRENREVFERGGVTGDNGSGCDLFEEAAHDLTGACFGQRIGEADLIRSRHRTDDVADMLFEVVADLVASMINHNEIANAKRPPLVMITKLQNKTGEVIDTQNVMDMVRVELSRGGRVAFVNREAREDVAAEYEYQGSGMVSEESKKGKGGQLGADFIIDGRLDSIVQQAGKDKTVYYKVTLQLTNLKTNVIAWTDYKQIRKKYRKQSVGL